jgi:hypothetical protein
LEASKNSSVSWKTYVLNGNILEFKLHCCSSKIIIYYIQMANFLALPDIEILMCMVFPLCTFIGMIWNVAASFLGCVIAVTGDYSSLVFTSVLTNTETAQDY